MTNRSARVYSGFVRTLTTWQTASLTFPCSAIELPSIAWLDTFTTTAVPPKVDGEPQPRQIMATYAQPAVFVLRLVHIGIASTKTLFVRTFSIQFLCSFVFHLVHLTVSRLCMSIQSLLWLRLLTQKVMCTVTLTYHGVPLPTCCWIPTCRWVCGLMTTYSHSIARLVSLVIAMLCASLMQLWINNL